MSEPVREIGTLDDGQGLRVEIGVDHEAITITAGGAEIKLGPEVQDWFMRLLMRALCVAEDQGDAEEIHEADGGDTMAGGGGDG